MTSKATIVICCTSQFTMEAKLDELLESVKSLAEEQKQNKTEMKVDWTNSKKMSPQTTNRIRSEL